MRVRHLVYDAADEKFRMNYHSRTRFATSKSDVEAHNSETKSRSTSLAREIHSKPSPFRFTQWNQTLGKHQDHGTTK
jgi:hypothetical protein